MNKPQPKDFGYQESTGFDTESGWMHEGGEEAYTEALEKWNKENRPLTCGPWIEVDGFIYGGREGDEKVCFIRDVIFTRANKNLICAAPEMLAMLEKITRRWNKENDDIYIGEYQEAMEIISKAKG